MKVLDTDFGRIAILVGDDSIYPEVFRLLAIQNVEVVFVPTHICEKWEVTTGLLERSAENRINIVVASRQTDVGSSVILALDEDFTLWTEWRKRPFCFSAHETLEIVFLDMGCAIRMETLDGL